MRAGNSLGAAFSALALMLACTSAHAEYKYDYSHGLQALEDHDYAKARKLIKQALDDHPEPAVRIRLYGQVWQPYLPQYYLGLVAFQQGDCATALSQWNAPASRDVVAQLPNIAAVQTRDSEICRNKMAATAPTKSPASPDAAKARAQIAAQPKPGKVAIAHNEGTNRNVVAKARPATPRDQPPQPLVDAFRDYLAGQYAQVARINPDSYAQPRARFHAYLVRAASKFTLARISGDARMLDSARSD
ncbi:MAG: hypothetical protein WBV39_07505, partial [Rudaea sp.]